MLIIQLINLFLIFKSNLLLSASLNLYLYHIINSIVKEDTKNLIIMTKSSSNIKDICSRNQEDNYTT